ncbi:hypothetical protein C7974DRAFT_60219 [Boeremia exigua]|uniref:uncharacterized protein n=1 Tax=Boeremia exigua TaxID=749465 RepID=UPI001E8E56DC|nr:uncharacterized protein C7974DRAFT_60219 [Boeremia exigua]KAH6615161.1 hypothetical protein C7974DRAFT_60219 [Boeremia exigua]
MSTKKGALADAWDDDWESLADKEEVQPEPIKPVKISKAERRAQHAQFNRELWESAENPEPMFLQSRNAPIQPTFKPAVTVLARKPTPQVLSRNAGMQGLSLEDDDDDSEEERQKKAAADFEERKIRAAKERAEKERKYAEARERIFGSPAASEESRSNSPSKPTRGKGRGRGGRDSQPRSSNEQSPARATAPGARQLYEPLYAPKPGSIHIQRKEEGGSRPGSRPATPSLQEKPVREPRGPARGGGRGFASRGTHGTVAGPS